MASIKKSVGKNGKNENTDTKVIQDLLNAHSKNGGYKKLKIDSLCGPKTCAAIVAFQNYICLPKVTSLVEPGKETFKALNMNPSKVKKDVEGGDDKNDGAEENDKGVTITVTRPLGKAEGSFKCSKPSLSSKCWWNEEDGKRIPAGSYSGCSATNMATKGYKAVFIPGVKGYHGIFIHQGSKPSDSEGCIIVPKKISEAIFDATKKDAKNIKVVVKDTGTAPKEDEKGAPAGKGKVTGPTNGVSSVITDALQSVADHYSITIVVTSGKRTPKDQARVMWENWKTNLKEGALYKVINSDKKLLKDLRAAYDKKDRKTFDSLIIPIAKKLSRHVRGGAVDVKKNTDSRAIKVLAMMFHHIAEKTCHHFDDKTTVKVPKDKWPK